jgi:hypothetical protein
LLGNFLIKQKFEEVKIWADEFDSFTSLIKKEKEDLSNKEAVNIIREKFYSSDFEDFFEQEIFENLIKKCPSGCFLFKVRIFNKFITL